MFNWDYSFSMFAKFSGKLTFLKLWYAHVHVRIRGWEMLVLRKILWTHLMIIFVIIVCLKWNFYLRQEDCYWIFFKWNEYSPVENLKLISLGWGEGALGNLINAFFVVIVSISIARTTICSFLELNEKFIFVVELLYKIDIQFFLRM